MRDLPPTSELVEGVLFYPIALVISATVFPGLTLCIPGLLFVTVLVLVPLVAMAVVVVLAAAVLAAPVVLVRVIRGLARRRSASKSQPRIAPAVDRRQPSLASSGSAQVAGSTASTMPHEQVTHAKVRLAA